MFKAHFFTIKILEQQSFWCQCVGPLPKSDIYANVCMYTIKAICLLYGSAEQLTPILIWQCYTIFKHSWLVDENINHFFLIIMWSEMALHVTDTVTLISRTHKLVHCSERAITSKDSSDIEVLWLLNKISITTTNLTKYYFWVEQKYWC